MVKRLLYILFLVAAVSVACSNGSRDSGRYKIALVPDMSGQHGIFVLNSDQTGGRLLTSDDTVQLRPGSWSPDGKKILFFAARDEDSAIRHKYRIPQHMPLYIMNSAGGGQRKLLDFPVRSFEWSPDSRQLLLVSAYEDPAHKEEAVQKGLKAPMSAAYLLNLESGVARRVTGFGPNCYGSWSPDGSRLALSFGEGAESSDIHVATLDGKRSRRVSSTPGINIRPVWSPDSRQIAYISFVQEAGQLRGYAWVMADDGRNTLKLPDVNPYEVAWSVDGESLLLSTLKGLMIVSPDGTVVLDMINKPIKPQDPVFTPDGKELMFRSNHEGPFFIYASDFKGAGIRRISGQLSVSMFCLSPLM